MTDYLKEISAYNIRPARPDPAACALLVIDMQAYFQPVAEPVLANGLALIRACRASGMPVVFTRHGHRDIATDGGMLAQWWGDYIPYGTNAWELIDALEPAHDDAIFDKNRYNAFHGTGLDGYLNSRHIGEVIIAGVLTNCCCETTAREAFVRDYRVFFASDATATVNAELHLATLKNMAFGFAHVMSTEEICKGLKNAR